MKRICIRQTVNLMPPDWLYSEESRKRDKGIAVDTCIASVIKHLWDQKVTTRGSCCGHSKNPPSVIVETHEDPNKVLAIIKEVDNRDWIVARWEVVEYRG